jgi:hypothetical protein
MTYHDHLTPIDKNTTLDHAQNDSDTTTSRISELTNKLARKQHALARITSEIAALKAELDLELSRKNAQTCLLTG